MHVQFAWSLKIIKLKNLEIYCVWRWLFKKKVKWIQPTYHRNGTGSACACEGIFLFCRMRMWTTQQQQRIIKTARILQVCVWFSRWSYFEVCRLLARCTLYTRLSSAQSSPFVSRSEQRSTIANRPTTDREKPKKKWLMWIGIREYDECYGLGQKV